MMLIRLSQHVGFLANLTFTLSSVIGVFLMTPLIIQTYGQGIYLLWVLINGICGLLFIVDFGITSVVAREFLTKSMLYPKFSRIVWNGFLFFHGKILLTGSFFASLIFLFQGHLGNVFKFSTSNLIIFISSLIATLATIASHQQVLKFQILGQYPRSLSIIALVKIIETAIIFLMLYSKFPFIGISVLIAAIHIFQVFLLRNLANRQLYHCAIDSSIKQRFEPRKQNFASSILYSASSVLGIHATFILQSLFLAPSQILIVAISRMIASPIRIFADSLAIGSFDKYIRRSLSHKNQQREVKYQSGELYFVLLGFSAIYILFINLIAKYVIIFLSHAQSTPNLLLLNLFCVATILDGSIVIYMQISISAGNLGKAGIKYFLSTIICLVLLVFVIHFLDVYAGVLSIIFCDFLFLLVELCHKNRKVLS